MDIIQETFKLSTANYKTVREHRNSPSFYYSPHSSPKRNIFRIYPYSYFCGAKSGGQRGTRKIQYVCGIPQATIGERPSNMPFLLSNISLGGGRGGPGRPYEDIFLLHLITTDSHCLLSIGVRTDGYP